MVSTPKQNPLICAVDKADVAEAIALVSEIKPYVGAVKLGLEFFTANGARGVENISALGVPIFLDLKFHDIPNTVASAITATIGINTFMMTVHTSGGQAMLRRAIEASDALSQLTGKERPLIIGVTLLTSLDQDDVNMIGFSQQLQEQVKRLADLAQCSGLDGVVCSPYEISVLREQCGDEFKLVVPGLRPKDTESGDQKRVMTPLEAYNRSADYLVVGRPITRAANPAEAAQKLAADLGVT